jgi:hypothetical protein
MPLHRDDPGRALQLNRFDDAVIGPRGCDQSGGDFVHRLMVVGRDIGGGTVHLADSAAGQRRDGVAAVDAYGWAVAGVTDSIGQVLDQCAAQRDVEGLQPAADTQHR